jgi:hypothetical protein
VFIKPAWERAYAEAWRQIIGDPDAAPRFTGRRHQPGPTT